MSDKREFWIIEETGYSTWVSSKPLNSADTTDEIHVIDYASYEKAISALKKAHGALEECKRDFEESQVDGANEEMIALTDKTLAEIENEVPELKENE